MPRNTRPRTRARPGHRADAADHDARGREHCGHRADAAPSTTPADRERCGHDADAAEHAEASRRARGGRQRWHHPRSPHPRRRDRRRRHAAARRRISRCGPTGCCSTPTTGRTPAPSCCRPGEHPLEHGELRGRPDLRQRRRRRADPLRASRPSFKRSPPRRRSGAQPGRCPGRRARSHATTGPEPVGMTPTARPTRPSYTWSTGARDISIGTEGVVTLNLGSIVDNVAGRLGLPANLGAKLPAGIPAPTSPC